MKKKKLKIVSFDIETFPIEAYLWTPYDERPIKIKKDWELASFAYKYLGEKKVHCSTRHECKTEKALVEKLYKVLTEADAIIAHNGDKFDVRKAKAKFLEHKLPPTPPLVTIDTMKMGKKHFGFSSNSLDHLANLLGIGRKAQTGGFSTWEGCMQGVKKAWRTMAKYNKQDVVLLEEVYLKLRPWAAHPNFALMSGESRVCPRCQGTKLKSLGWKHNKTVSYRKFRCLKCLGYVRSDKKADNKPKYQVIN